VPSILDSVQNLAKKRLPEKAAMAGTRLMPGGIGMVLGGFGGFSAGNDVIQAAKQSFGSVPKQLPEWLEPIDVDGDGVPDPSAFETGMRGAVGKFVEGSNGVVAASTLGISTAATAVGIGVTSAASIVSSPFRSLDLDGDGIPDEARALSAVKGAGRVASGAAGSLRGATSSLFRSRKKMLIAGDSPDADDVSQSSDQQP
jgi:hypothetical protein